MLDLIRRITSGRDENGASAVEYGLLVAGIAALIAVIVFVFGGAVKDSINKSCGTFSAGVSATSASTCQ